MDETLQSGAYRDHMGHLAAALLAASAPPCAQAGGVARGWPSGFAPLPPPQLAPAWDAATRRQLRPLLRRLPPALQARVALAARGSAPSSSSDSIGDALVTSELERVAGPTRLADALAAHRDSGGRSAMHAAAELGLERAVALLARLCPGLAATADAAGVTPLGLAARAGATEAGRALLAAGADANDDDTVRMGIACAQIPRLTHRCAAAASRRRS